MNWWKLAGLLLFLGKGASATPLYFPIPAVPITVSGGSGSAFVTYNYPGDFLVVIVGLVPVVSTATYSYTITDSNSVQLLAGNNLVGANSFYEGTPVPFVNYSTVNLSGASSNGTYYLELYLEQP